MAQQASIAAPTPPATEAQDGVAPAVGEETASANEPVVGSANNPPRAAAAVAEVAAAIAAPEGGGATKLQKVDNCLATLQMLMVVVAGVCGIIGETSVFSQLDTLYLPKKPCSDYSEGSCQWWVGEENERNTGGTCMVEECFEWRNAQCEGSSCICEQGQMAIHGRCVDVSITTEVTAEMCAEKTGVIGTSECGSRALVLKECYNSRGDVTCNDDGYCECTENSCMVMTEADEDDLGTCQSDLSGTRGYQQCVEINSDSGASTGTVPDGYKCGADLMLCQALIMQGAVITSVSGSVDTGISGSVDVGEVEIASASVGRQESENEATCGILSDCSMDLTNFYAAEMQRPALPYTFLWLLYRLLGLPILVGGCAYCAGGASLFELTMIQCCPLLPKSSNLCPGLPQTLSFFTYLKLYIVPQLMIPMVSTMSQVDPCNAIVTRAPSFEILTTICTVVICHLIVSILVCSINSCLFSYLSIDEIVEHNEAPGLYVLDDDGKRVGVNYSAVRSASPRIGNGVTCCVGILSFFDVVIIGMIPVYVMILGSQFGANFALGIKAAFSFNVGASVFVDLFQVMMFFLNFVDLIKTLRKVCQGNKEKQEKDSPVGKAIEVLENNQGA